MPETTIVPYNRLWPETFAQEKARFKHSIGPWLVNIEHMGSTSISGIAAKPVIDLLAV